MEKIRDIIYDKSDLFVALFIIIVAAMVMFNKTDIIMKYPAEVSRDLKVSQVVPKLPEKETGNKAATPSAVEPATETAIAVSEPVVELHLSIASGATAPQIADQLINLNLIEARDQFLSAIYSFDAVSKLKPGEFVIPSNANLKEIVDILTS